MKLNKKEVEYFIIGLVIVITICFGASFLLNPPTKTPKSSNHEPYSNILNNEITSIYLNKIIEKVKEEHQNLNLVYESEKLDSLKSLVYEENNRYKSIIISNKTGKEINFEDLIIPDKKSAYDQKITELLKNKYPEFIVNVLITVEGVKTYYVKDNEVIIYYYDYPIPYDYKEQLSLKVNYQEIKDFLNFKPILDTEYENESGYNYDPNRKNIALTFDDGPSSKYNPLILAELAKNKAHATFFMVGNMMNSCQSCVLNTYQSGNEVASHTYEHMNIKNNSVEKVSTSINKVKELYTSITGDTIKLLRPPYGAYSKTNLENISEPLILWNLDTNDWRYRDVEKITTYIKENASDGSIILMHELYETSYQAVVEILPWLYANGYNVVSVSELAKLQNRTIEPGKAYTSLK